MTPTARIKDSRDVPFPVAILQASHIFISSVCRLIYSVKYNCYARQTLIRKSNTQAVSQPSCGQRSSCPACKPVLRGECRAAQLCMATGWPPALQSGPTSFILAPYCSLQILLTKPQASTMCFKMLWNQSFSAPGDLSCCCNTTIFHNEVRISYYIVKRPGRKLHFYFITSVYFILVLVSQCKEHTI